MKALKKITAWGLVVLITVLIFVSMAIELERDLGTFATVLISGITTYGFWMILLWALKNK